MEDKIKKAEKIIRERTVSSEYNNQYCILSQEDIDGCLTAAVITPSKSDGIKQITFCTGLGSNKVTRARRDSRAAVCFGSDTYSITLIGRLEVVTDAAFKHGNWYSGLENHFSGADDSNYCVLRFTTERYSLFIDWEEIDGTL